MKKQKNIKMKKLLILALLTTILTAAASADTFRIVGKSQTRTVSCDNVTMTDVMDGADAWTTDMMPASDFMGVLGCFMKSGKSGALAGSGSIWTTNIDCGDEDQDINHFAVGHEVHINGANFAEGTYLWTITGNPGGSSCDPGLIVASGNVIIDSTGAFCIDAYTIQVGDCGEYKVDVDGKNDNYRVDDTTTTTTTQATTTTLATTTTQITTTTVPTTTTTVPNATEFASLSVLAAILMTSPAFAYLAVKKRQ